MHADSRNLNFESDSEGDADMDSLTGKKFSYDALSDDESDAVLLSSNSLKSEEKKGYGQMLELQSDGSSDDDLENALEIDA